MEKTIGVVGLGSMGEKHVKTCLEHSRNPVVLGCTRSRQRRQEVEEKWGIPTISDYRELSGQVDGVIVAVPTQLHQEVASFFLECKVPVLLEKPIAADLAQAAQLVALACRTKTVLQVGHVERFNPAWRAAQRWWQANVGVPPDRVRAIRLSPPPNRDMQVGTTLDMMVHDLDLVRSLFETSPTVTAAQTLTVTGADADDWCMAKLAFPSGGSAEVTAGRIANERVRRLDVIGGQVQMTVDMLNQQVWVTPGGPNSEKLVIESGFPLEYQLTDFLQAIDGGVPQVSGEEGYAALELAYAILKEAGR